MTCGIEDPELLYLHRECVLIAVDHPVNRAEYEPNTRPSQKNSHDLRTRLRADQAPLCSQNSQIFPYPVDQLTTHTRTFGTLRR